MVYDLKTENLKFTLKGHTKQVNDLVLSEDKMNLFSGSDDMTIKVWNISTKKCI